MCALIDFLWYQMQELYCIKVNEEEIDRIFAETLQKQEPNPSRLRSLVWPKEDRSIKKTQSPSNGKSPFPSAAVPLKRRFRALEERKGKKVPLRGKSLGWASWVFRLEPALLNRKQWVLVVEIFFLHGTRAANFHNNYHPRKFAAFLELRSEMLQKRLPRLVWPCCSFI